MTDESSNPYSSLTRPNYMNLPIKVKESKKIPTTMEALLELKNHLEIENAELKKELSKRESEKNKQIAVLEQKVSLLQ